LIPDPRKPRAGSGFLVGSYFIAEIKRLLKKATYRFWPCRNISLLAPKALDRVEKLVFQPNVDPVSAISRLLLVHGLNLPMHQTTLPRETLFA
jgi:hypothetical protein